MKKITITIADDGPAHLRGYRKFQVYYSKNGEHIGGISIVARNKTAANKMAVKFSKEKIYTSSGIEDLWQDLKLAEAELDRESLVILVMQEILRPSHPENPKMVLFTFLN